MSIVADDSPSMKKLTAVNMLSQYNTITQTFLSEANNNMVILGNAIDRSSLLCPSEYNIVAFTVKQRLNQKHIKFQLHLLHIKGCSQTILNTWRGNLYSFV